MSDSDSGTVLIDKNPEKEPTGSSSKTPEKTKTFFDDVIKIVNLGMYDEPKGSIEKAKEKLNSEKCCRDE